MPTRVRVAIIGTGMIGAVHRRASQSAGADVIGVLASSPAKSAQVANDWNVPRGYATLAELLADRPDVVQICTPNESHHRLALTIIEAGINVVCEKPLGVSTEQARELAEAAERKGVVATVPYVYRYHPLVRELRARGFAGEFGNVLLVHGSYLQDWLLDPLSSSWRVQASQGGKSRAFADIGSHWSDLAEFITGLDFVSVSASTTIAYPTRPAPDAASFTGAAHELADFITVDTEDAAVVTFRAATGVIANTVISQVSGGRKNRLWIEIDGSKASAVFDQENPDSIWIGQEASATILNRGAGTPTSEQDRLNLVPAGHPQGYLDAFTAFLDDTYAAVRGEHRPGLPTFADGLRSAQLIDAVLRSAQTGAWVDVQSADVLERATS